MPFKQEKGMFGWEEASAFPPDHSRQRLLVLLTFFVCSRTEQGKKTVATYRIFGSQMTSSTKENLEQRRMKPNPP